MLPSAGLADVDMVVVDVTGVQLESEARIALDLFHGFQDR